MRPRTLIGTAAITIGWLAACSKPAPQTAKTTRDLSLPAPAGSDAPLVSTLEAGQPVAPITTHQPAHRAAPAAAPVHQMADVSPAVESAPMALPQILPVTGSTSLALTSAEHLPGAATFDGESDGTGILPGDYTAGTHHRDPVIIIRGGLGTPDDKCDLRPRGGRGGTAVNRSAPSFGRSIH